MEIKEVEVVTKQIHIPNIYGDDELFKDLKEQVKMWGDKFWNTENSELGIDLDSRTTSGRVAYLPDYTRKLWKRHLIMNLSYLSSMHDKNKESLEKYLNERFGEKNWFYGQWNKIKIILIKNLLEKPVSTISNRWSLKLSQDRNNIVLTKIDELPKPSFPNFHQEIQDIDIGKGFFYHKGGTEK